MGLAFDSTDGQTPLDEEESEGLLIPTISTRGELDEFEQQNIERALQWTLGRYFKPATVFTEHFIRMIHERMFGDVWSWAGDFRKSNRNIGVDKWQIPTALKSLLDDALYWHENNIYNPDEIAIRFKHRIVSIHCFPNGNGRHSRLMADIIVANIYKQPVFTWGSNNFSGKKDARTVYLKSLKEADRGAYESLLGFARS
ncbi:mobile mystery protein B [Flavihumibacter cheonanensis]|uniref:mobile mystery protein B n=1 Tax=Flavihumibacter cheonanensis TaxID=1442385 RepID=UPI001EF8F3D0|nr:mobile mystery protein B [Flavihumibacter cheonanensis]MCG7753990.1 mobile mystery protein B [Flavihumibacter cheonanensis]